MTNDPKTFILSMATLFVDPVRKPKEKSKTSIYEIVGEADTAENGETDDKLVMVLEDFTADLTLDMFDLPNRHKQC